MSWMGSRTRTPESRRFSIVISSASRWTGTSGPMWTRATSAPCRRSERLHGALVARVHIGPLVPVHLDADEITIENLRDSGVLVRLPIHDMAPVTPHGADIEQDRLVLLAGARERRVAPGRPVDGLV